MEAASQSIQRMSSRKIQSKGKAMNFIIPMAGLGSRFTEAGYDLPKYLLEAHGATLLEWSVNSLPLDLATVIVFVGMRSHNEEHQVENFIQRLYSQYDLCFVWLDEPTRGQSETVVKATEYLDPSLPLVIFNIDTAFRSNDLRKKLSENVAASVIGCFNSCENRFSYAHIGTNGDVDVVREKEVISDYALTGFYHFRTAEIFLQVANATIKGKKMEKGEYYVAPLYNDCIAMGERVTLDHCDAHCILGTPQEYEAFRNSEAHLTLKTE